MKGFIKLSSALVVLTAMGTVSLPAYSAVQPDFAKIEARKERKTQIVGERTGRQLVKAFDLYNEEKVEEAIAVLLDTKSSNEFDTATLNRFLGNLYATKDEKKAIQYLTIAVKPDILVFNDQATSLRLLADLLLQDKQYRKAIDAYEAWLLFTGEQNSDAYMRIANAYYLMNQHDKVIAPADDAIRFADKPIPGPYQLKMAALYETKRYKELVAVVEVMVELFPENKQFWVYLGNFYTLTEEYSKSLSTLHLAHTQGYLEKDSELRMLAQMYANNNIPFKAAKVMEANVKSGLVKGDKTNLSFIANNYQAAREFEKAAEYFGELAKVTNDADAYRRQGSAYLSIQRYNDAIKAFDKALSMNVDKPSSVYMSLVDAYFYQSKYKEAYAALMNAKKDPNMSRQVRSWESYIKDKAKQKGVSL
ncbi:tetratricopeptide repeat protein [Rheinheimera sp. WS51]|uniref:tetratricopeptide repeat protein n=1 Tax=Rheinheimera sp. WS51 TaxID=3425886 RepID=UPI003D8A574D